MSEVAGVHRRVVYRATFSETEGQTRWFATFDHDGQMHESHGVIRGGWSVLPTIECRVHVTMQLYIESALLGDVTAAETESGAANG